MTIQDAMSSGPTAVSVPIGLVGAGGATSMIWFRPRAKRLFDFEHRFEIFIPSEKRKWGCYLLPFLMGDRLVARVDLKADRSERHLRVLAAHLEPHAKAGQVAEALAVELRAMAGWLEMNKVTVEGRRGFARTLAAELDHDR